MSGLRNIRRNRIAGLLRKSSCPFLLYVGRKKLAKRRTFEQFIEDYIELEKKQHKEDYLWYNTSYCI
ncbi:MAG: hypothetical protein EGR90_05615 [Lachnospiraceae bacterium]|nr:hypothetical protein [Lachnospiraceae bacterium]